ncbi:MAG: hypothetical protein WC326_14475 [Candidatus Delongbacteria bacterium]
MADVHHRWNRHAGTIRWLLGGLWLTGIAWAAAPTTICVDVASCPATIHVQRLEMNQPVVWEGVVDVILPRGPFEMELSNPWGMNPVSMEVSAADLALDSMSMDLWLSDGLASMSRQRIPIHGRRLLDEASQLIQHHRLVVHSDSNRSAILRRLDDTLREEGDRSPWTWTGDLWQGDLPTAVGRLLSSWRESGLQMREPITLHGMCGKAGRKSIHIRGIARELLGSHVYATTVENSPRTVNAVAKRCVTNQGERELVMSKWADLRSSASRKSHVKFWPLGSDWPEYQEEWGQLSLDPPLLSGALRSRIEPGGTVSWGVDSTEWKWDKVVRDSQKRGMAGTTVASLDMVAGLPGQDDRRILPYEHHVLESFALRDWLVAGRIDRLPMGDSGIFRYPWFCHTMGTRDYTALELGAVTGLDAARQVFQETRAGEPVWHLDVQFTNTEDTPLEFTWREIQGHTRWTLLESEPAARAGANGLALDVPVRVPARGIAHLNAVLGVRKD